ncbi:MAG: hypothetical protein ACXVPQ_08865 [Bacteroidia bacterium]
MKYLTIICFAIFSLALHAQDQNKNVDPKYRYCYKETSLETDDYKVYIVDAVNENTYSKVKIRIFNKTNDYLIFKPSEFSFLINGQDLASKDKQIIVMPNEEVAKVIDTKGKGLQANKYTLEIKAYYKVAANSPALKAEDFQLPATKNDFTVGGFRCKLIDSKIKTEKSVARFGCNYEGDNVGILDPYKASAVMPAGKDNANSRRYDPVLLEKGKYEDFSVDVKEISGGGDMQKAGFKIKWNDSFKDAKLTSHKGTKIDLELDPEKTADQNK